VRAIDIVEIALQTFDAPLYVRKEIVHNPHVVADLRQKGARFVEELDDVPPGERVIFSAHGVSPKVRKRAQSESLEVIDATCPLVTKVHNEAKRFAEKGYTIILIGHVGHEEVEGTMGEAPDHIKLVSSVADVEKLEVEDREKISYLTQTTLSLNDTKVIVAALRAKYPNIEGPPSEDICYATQNRQEAVRELAKVADLILVVGAENSSNSNRLVEEAVKHGTCSYLISDVRSIDLQWLDNVEVVGITSGASAPEGLVDDVVSFFTEQGAEAEELVTRQENVQFALPPALALR
jgi:4-hydroxy-3-methylbut-2-enyl diphosphate reductase